MEDMEVDRRYNLLLEMNDRLVIIVIWIHARVA